MRLRTALVTLLTLGVALVVCFSVPFSAEQRVLRYEVMVDNVELPATLTEEQVALWVDQGWLRPEEPDAPKAPDNRFECHLVYYYYGDGFLYCDCVRGAGAVDCYCEDSPQPPNW